MFFEATFQEILLPSSGQDFLFWQLNIFLYGLGNLVYNPHSGKNSQCVFLNINNYQELFLATRVVSSNLTWSPYLTIAELIFVAWVCQQSWTEDFSALSEFNLIHLKISKFIEIISRRERSSQAKLHLLGFSINKKNFLDKNIEG